MAMPSLAFSVHNFISSVGADAGFAAIIGLAVLVLLYFAHARETANLREEATLLTQRLQQAEARVHQLTRAQAASPAADSAAQQPEQAAAFAPFAPAGAAAPALGAATHAIPLALSEELEPSEVLAAAEEQPASVSVGALAMAGVGAAASTPSPPPTAAPASPPSESPPPPPSAVPPPPVPSPATNAGGNGSAHQADAPAPVPAAPVPTTPVSTTVPPVPGWSPRPAASAASRPVSGRVLPPLEVPRRRRRSWRNGRGMAAAVAALAAVAAAVVWFAVTSAGGSSNTTPGSRTTNAPPARHSAAAAFKPSSVTVAVLNGTAVNQLAHKTAAKLTALGYKQGTVATASNQTESATVVAYRPSSSNRTDALHVASALGLRRAAVQPVDQSTLQIACPVPSSCAANVVVTVGTDLASQ